MKILKIHVFTIFLLLISLSLFAQNLPNYNFEVWDDSGKFNEPIDWGTSNFSIVSVISFNTVKEETTDTYSGNSSIKLETIEKNVGGDNVKIAGLITLGTFDVNISTREAVVSGGVPMFLRPSIFSGYYKYSPVGIDSCIMSIILTKYNSVNKSRDTIGTGIFTSGAQETWDYFEVPVNYTSSGSPDTLNIIILSSDTSIFEPGSMLLLDDLYIDQTLGFSSSKTKPEVKIFPNPASDYLNVNYTGHEKYDLSIVNSIGNIVLNSNKLSNDNEINLTGISPGFYFLTISFDDNKTITKKFIIK